MDILRLRQFKELISGWDLVPCEDFQIMRQHCFPRLEILCAHAIIWYWNLPWEKSLFVYHLQCQTLRKIFTGPTYKLFWALLSFQMFTAPLFQMKWHLLSTVLLSGELWNPLSKAVPDKFHRSDRLVKATTFHTFTDPTKKYAHKVGTSFGLVPVNFTHILQDYFTDTRAILPTGNGVILKDMGAKWIIRNLKYSHNKTKQNKAICISVIHHI